jgi:hypothetical protein
MNRFGITHSTELLKKCAGLVYTFVFFRRGGKAKFSSFFFQFSDSLLIDLLFIVCVYRMDSGPALDGVPFCFYPASFWLWC